MIDFNQIKEKISYDKDAQEVLNWCKQHTEYCSAVYGNSNAPCYLGYLGFLYEHGIGVNQNFDMAILYYELAADKGNSDAEFQLSLCYNKGIGVKVDNIESMKWLKLAADHGNSDAQFHLAISYEYGTRGLEKNMEKAIELCKLAVDNGNKEACYYFGEYYQPIINQKEKSEMASKFKFRLKSPSYETICNTSIIILLISLCIKIIFF